MTRIDIATRNLTHKRRSLPNHTKSTIVLLPALAFPLKTYAQEVWYWGDNWYGQLGDGTTTQKERPVHVSQDLNGNPFGDVEKSLQGIITHVL